MKRGNRRSAACGRISEAISRKCPDWRPRQWPGIGWHDGGPERVAAVKIGGARHKAARKFCPPQQGHPHSLALHPLSCRPRGTFCQQRQKVTKERRQNQGFEILCAAGLPSAWKPSATRTGRAGLSSCFRIVSASTAAGRSRGPALPCHIRDAPCIYRAGKEPAAPLAMHP